ncbi:translation initiation factor IF-2 [Streptomyces sennicomposti]
MKKGLEQAPLEWPVAASATGAVPALDTGDAGGDGTQRFPETAAVPALRVEDPWERSGPDTADPAELTVRLDRAEAGADGADAARGSDGPVFVDESGRRSRRFRRIGVAVGLSCGAYAVVIAVTLVSGNSNAPWLPVPGQADDGPASKVETSPEPSESVLPPGTGDGAVPGAPGLPGVTGISAPGAGKGAGSAKPGTGAGAPAPSTSAGPHKAGATPGAKPTAAATGRTEPPAGGVAGPTTAPTPPPATTPPAPTPTGGSTAPDPTTSPGGGSGDGGNASGGGGGAVTNAPGTVADGPSGPVPISSEPAATGAPGPTTAPGPASPPGPTGSPADGAGTRPSGTVSRTVA